MYKGDIDNSVPARVLVHMSAVVNRVPTFKKVLRLIPVHGHEYSLDSTGLAYVNHVRDRNMVVMEAYTYNDDDWDHDRMLDLLEDQHHPFTRFYEFGSATLLSTYLASNNDVSGVIDPTHPGRFGSWSAL